MSNSAALGVSRETSARLEVYVDLLKKWNPRINLVAKSTVSDVWRRHVADSAQLHELAPHPVDHWADLGSGGGFPGLVIAILAKEFDSPSNVTLVESDSRKCAFLRTVARETDLAVTVVNDRVENLPHLGCDVVTARALTDLSILLSYAHANLREGGMALFPKGVTWKKELAEAQQKWKFEHHEVKSVTEDGPVILRITGVSRV